MYYCYLIMVLYIDYLISNNIFITIKINNFLIYWVIELCFSTQEWTSVNQSFRKITILYQNSAALNYRLVYLHSRLYLNN